MIRRRLCYLLLLAAGGYFIMLYDFQGLRFLFGCVICIPAVSFLFLIPMSLGCRTRLAADREAVMRGEALEAKITVENKGVLPVPGVLLELHWKMPGEREVKVRKWVRCMGRNEKEIFHSEVSAMHCGQASLELTGAKVCDYLGLFSLPARKKGRAEICITPIVTPVASQVETAYSQTLQGGGGEREGDMLLRDFQPGDSLHRIYWKLMAKGGDLQVRDFERSSSVSLFLDFSDDLRDRAEMWDRYLDRAVSFLYFLAEECRQTIQISVEVVWQQGDAFFSFAVQDGDAAQAWVCALLREEALGTALSEEEIPTLEQGWHMDEDCRLYFGEQCVYEE